MTTKTAPKLPRIVDLGCGRNIQPGALGVDNTPGDDVTSLVDLDATPWPFPDDHFLVAYMRQSLEHLSHPVSVMQELYRICRHGALVFIQVPNGVCPGYVQDPDHKHPWNLGAFLYFAEPKQWPTVWEERQRDYGTRFRILHYHTTGPKPGRTPWGSQLYADNLTVVMQVIKEEDPADDE